MTPKQVALYRAAFARLGPWPSRSQFSFPMCDAERAARAAKRAEIEAEFAS